MSDMRGSRKICQRGPTLTFLFFFLFFFLGGGGLLLVFFWGCGFLVDQRREDPNTTISDPSSVIFRGSGPVLLRSPIFSGGPDPLPPPPPPSGSA